MAKFTYRMQNILDIKIKLENQAKIAYATASQEIRECKRAIDVMKSLQRAQMMKVHAAEKTLEMARIELNRVMVERKTHEKLRERAFEEFKQEIAQAESKEIDELVSYNYHEG